MNKNLISYILFGSEPRYWSNVPYLLVTNSAIYQDFHMRFYVHKESTVIPCFNVLQEVSKINLNVEIEIVEDSYVGTKLTTWRVKPLWEDDIDVLLCRDVDYAINLLERKSVEYFIRQSDCIVHGIRSYHLHTAPYMAGLCGFKVKEVAKMVKPKASTFYHFLNWGTNNVSYCADWRWGCDQALLRDFLNVAGLYPATMDCPQYTAPLKIYQFNAKTITPNLYDKISMRNCDGNALVFSNSIAPSFTGQPWSCDSNSLRTLCGMVNNATSDIVKKYI